MIRIGVIGCGKIAQTRHLPEYDENPNCEIAGYYDINSKYSNQMAEKYGGKIYDSYEELLQDKSIDAVSVCVANNAHAEVSIAALKAGKHVLCEKPMAVTLEECEEMVRTSKETHKNLMIDHNQRLAKAHAKAQELINQGIIGKILTFRAIFAHGGPETWSVGGKATWFFNKGKAAFGAMADLGIHKVDIIQFLLNDTVAEVSAMQATLDKKDIDGNPISVDDNVICLFRMRSGVLGTMTASWTNYSHEDNSTVLYGTDGVMRIYDDPEYSIIVDKKNGERYCYKLDRIQTNDNQTKSGIIDIFVDSILKNKEPAIPCEEALSAMKVIFACDKSAHTGKIVSV